MNGLQSMVILPSVEEFGVLLIIYTLVVDFYNHINLLYGSITEFCSPHSCPEMKATDEYVVQTTPRKLIVLILADLNIYGRIQRILTSKSRQKCRLQNI